MQNMNQDNVVIFDTTLRDGEQALRASLSKREKLQIAHAIAKLGVDVMEVGFPVSSPGDFDAVKSIAEQVKGPIICGLARAMEKDIIACGEALAPAEKRRIHTFIATSPIHLEHKLQKTLEQATEMAVKAIKLAKTYTDDVEFSCEDAGRTPVADLAYVIERAIDAGATTINIPDTVGYTEPTEFAEIIAGIKQQVPNIDKAIISVHCHNDLGLAVANSIAAVQAGARQIECTVNGIGERAGNCALEEVAMIMQTRKERFGVTTNIKSEEIFRTSKLVSQLCNMPVQQNKAIVGANAFAHSSGIHQDGILKAQNTYEIMKPEHIGMQSNELNLTSRSGRHVIQHRMAEMGYSDKDYNLNDIYDAFLLLADKKGQVHDYDLEAIVFNQQLEEESDYYKLNSLQGLSSNLPVNTATVGITIGGTEVVFKAETGNGPIEAAYKALKQMTKVDLDIIDFKLNSKGEGADAIGQVDIIAKCKGRNFHGTGLATDIIHAGVKAYIHVLNLIHRAQQVEDIKEKHQGI
ncbi:MAG: 2-isopropylmalate synthase [Psychrosphaera sp.]|jgi:2-isopropylmalate synthase